jgi:hypothetical protein
VRRAPRLSIAGFTLMLGLAACQRQPAGPAPSGSAPVASLSPSSSPSAPAPSSSAALAADAAAPIGAAGGIHRGAGAQIVVPPDALSADVAFTITKVTGAALAEWPRGTEIGYAFEPAGTRFRVPVTLKLPHPPGEGEVVCQTGPGERLTFQFEAMPDHRFPVHVVELPHRCAVYSPEHVRALKAVRDREGAHVKRTNERFRWQMKGKVCDPHDFVRPNAGKDLREPPGLGGCPPGMARVAGKPDVCVDRWEAHLVEILDDGTEHTYSPYFNPGDLKVRAKSAPRAVPQAYISQVQAASACAAAKKRLCRDDEWVAACRGAAGAQFPYGKDEKRGTCNDHRDKHPAMQYLETQDLSVFTKLEHPCINQVADSLLPGGAKEACATAEGVFDIVGNLHEWTADPKGHFRGGYYVDTWLNGRGCDYLTTAHEARYWDYSTGFRCCADAPK